MERIEFFAQEIAIQKQVERDAKMLVRGPGQLLKKADEIAAAAWKRVERRKIDAV